MSQRRLHVLHVLATRGNGEARQVLFHPHATWSVPDSGKQFLTVFTKKIAADPSAPTVSTDALRDALAAVLREDLGLGAGRPAWEDRLPRTAVEMCSPARGVGTTYSIWPVEVRLDPARHDGLRARLAGEWLTEREALRRPYLSPTARSVLERATPAPEPAARLLSADDWSLRLVAARAGNTDLFGPLSVDMMPWLRSQLRRCECTRGLRADEVEDALQDGVLNALKNLNRFDPRLGSAATWMRTLTHHAAVTILRRRGRAVVSLCREDGGPTADVPEFDGDPAVLSERREEMDHLRRRLRQALEICAPPVRRAWKLRHVRGLSYAEIAAKMGQPFGTIATWIHRVKTTARGLRDADGPAGGQSP
ncbi:MAG TPA: RNA polymerase sigma factor [Gemmataceae bacterium]|nr:RNA polymerase sigma factor [Gemmataceae bacterium]